MLPYSVLLAAAVAQVVSGSVPSGPSIPDDSPVHLGITLRLTNGADLTDLLERLQDPASPDYRRWLTAPEFGERYGQSPEIYDQAVHWLAAAGLSVTQSPNRLFLEGQGTAAQVSALLALQLQPVAGHPASVHAPSQPPTFPAFLQGLVVHISGLDTRTHYRHRLIGNDGKAAFGPQDLRRFYGAQPLLDQGYVGQHQQLVVLSEAETEQNAPSPVAINYFLRNISDSSAVFSEAVVVPGTTDFDPEGGGGVEFSLDSEMQSVGAPGADSITLVVPPSSEVFTTGVQYIVNNLDTATAVSISLGLCEPGVEQNPNDVGLPEGFHQALQQGLSEGQTWSAATGDHGADDCQDGTDVAVDFPASIPEMVAVGGTEVNNPNWDQDSALTAYQQETGWNGGAGGGAGGGGFSILFKAPSYQRGFPFLADGGRSLPDIALIAGDPSVLLDDSLPGVLGSVQGTSVASPLSAGFFALIASRVGCRLGDVHPVLYMLGNAQLDGGVKVFNDVTAGSASYDGVAGPRAAKGYDSDTGWGSLDVQALAEAWPPCRSDGGFGEEGPAYDPCGILACGAGSDCITLPEGPSSCVVACEPADAESCGIGTVCSNQTPFSDDAGACVAGCRDDVDCADAGEVCSTCERVCLAPGKSTAGIGDSCVQSTDCPAGSTCLSLSGVFQNGYCSQPCAVGVASAAACGCPSGSACDALGYFSPGDDCVQTCATVGAVCGPQSGFLCQPNGNGNACLPACQIDVFGSFSFDTCLEYNSGFSCDTSTGVCSIPLPDAGTTAEIPDGGSDAGVDAGPVDAGVDGGEVAMSDAGSSTGPSSNGHSGGCATGEGGVSALWGLVALVAVRRHRRQKL